jgi:CRISPR-associated endonuclease/helicase Cas3
MEIKIWGKSKVNEREISLSEHIKDVLAVHNSLFNNLSLKVKSDLLELIKIVITYHDAGKVLPYYQRKIIKNESYQPFDVYTNIPHSILSALLVDHTSLKKRLETIFGNDEEKIENYSKYIISAIAYHHWRDNFYDIVEGFTDVFERLRKLVDDQNKWKQIEENLKAVYSKIGNEDIKISINTKWLDGLTNGIRFADYVIPPYLLYRMPKRIEMESSELKDWILISGFTMICDHFASFLETEGSEMINSEMVEINGLLFDEIKRKIDKELKGKIEYYDSSKIWQFQEVDIYKDHNTILLAPTGIGKTEFSYLWSNGEKFFYTLPLRTAVNQIYNRTKRIFGDNKTGILHSDADVYILGEGGETESMKIYDFSRQLSYPAIISTGDQFFPYALRPPSYEKIFAKFSYSRLIIDEIQAYDPKAAAIIVKFIEHIDQMGGKFLLMTATLPRFIRDEIDRRFKNQDESKNYKELNLFDEKELSDFTKHKVQLKLQNYKDEQLSYSNELIAEIIQKSEENNGSRVLVVMNTVKQAQAIFDDLCKVAKGVDVKLFHSRFTQKHRKEKEDMLSEFIGNNDKSRADKRPKILVATQVVEASLDLDADFLFTELAPWDALIQRMGRVLREAHPKNQDLNEIIGRRYKANGKKTPQKEPTLFDQLENEEDIPENVFILVYNGTNKKGKQVYESGQGHVYNDELLRISIKFLEDINLIFNSTIPTEEIKKWNEDKKVKLKLESLTTIPFELSESNKAYLVDALYRCLSLKGEYLKDFNNMLEILDAGFMSDRKSEAQKIFREINDVSVVAEKETDNFINELNTFDFKQKYAYTHFKDEILSKYIVSVQRNKIKESLYESNQLINRIKINDSLEENTKENFYKLKNWLYGIYIVPLDYNEINGLIGINDLSIYL